MCKPKLFIHFIDRVAFVSRLPITTDTLGILDPNREAREAPAQMKCNFDDFYLIYLFGRV